MGRNVGAWQLIILCVSGGGQREAAAGGGLLVGAIFAQSLFPLGSLRRCAARRPWWRGGSGDPGGVT